MFMAQAVRVGLDAKVNQPVQSVEHALATLNLFLEGNRELSVSEVSRALSLHPSSASRLLRTLEAWGYLERRGPRGKYRIGVTPIALASVALSQLDLRQRVLPFLEQLVERLDLSANLAIYHQGYALFLAHISNHWESRVFAVAGKRGLLHATAVGKCLLADMPETAVRRLASTLGLPRRTPSTITNVEQFLAELRLVQQRGYALDNEEAGPAVRCVAAPLRDAQGKTIAAISVSGPVQALTLERVPEVARIVMQVAYDISQALA